MVRNPGKPSPLVVSPCQYVDPAGTLQSGHLTIVDGRIASLDRPPTKGATVLDGAGLVFFPGLIQGHVHLCQTIMRGVADDVPLQVWLEQFIWPLEALHSPESLAASASLGIAELLLGGTTTIVDMGTVHHTDALFETAERMGIRYFGGKTLMTDPEMVPKGLLETTRKALDECAALTKRWHGKANGRLNNVISPRFRVSCTPDTIREAAALAKEQDLFFHTHASETQWEVAYIRRNTRRGNISELAALEALGPKTLLAHGIWIEPGEWKLLRESGTMVVHCPSANCKLGSGIFPMEAYRRERVPFCLGADGPPCNNNLDALLEARLSLHLQNAKHGAGWVGAKDAFDRLTTVPADYLGIEAGRIVPGARADLFAVRTEGTLGAPLDWSQPIPRLIYADGSRDVAATIVDGRPLVWEGKLVDHDHAEIIAKAREHRARMMKAL